MALPRYLYSVNNSMHAPLLAASSSSIEQERELETTVTVNPASKEHTTTSSNEALDLDRDAKFGDGVELGSPGETNVHTTSTKFGVQKAKEDEEDLLLTGIRLASNSNNLAGWEEVQEDSVHRYGAYDDRHSLNNVPYSNRNSTTLSTVASDVVLYKNDTKRTKWEDAALFIREGEDNAKFTHHPRGKWSKIAYKILHHFSYYVIHLIVCVLIMLLALFENPAITNDFDITEKSKKAITVAHAVFEIVFLAFLWFDILLRFLWFRPKEFFKHKRTICVVVVLLVMLLEAIAVLARQQNHLRITRALRTVFIIDTYLMVGVRRVLRQIFLCIKPIVDVLVLLIFCMVFFSMLGYYIFAEIDPTYFDSLTKSIVSFFITTTTANNPDVMMEAYSQQSATPVFFIIYIVAMVYFISNVLLAVVYSSFSEADKNKFKQLFLHKRDALRHAYNVLASSDQGITFHDFLLFMQCYRPRVPEWQVMCIFKALRRDPCQQHTDLSLEEFYGFYEVRDFKWIQVTTDGEEVPWFDHFHHLIKTPISFVRKLVDAKWFNLMINMIVFVNFLFLLIYSLSIPKEEAQNRFKRLQDVLAVSFTFVCIYLVEILLKIIGLGPGYFHKTRHVLDTILIVISFVLLICEATTPYLFLAVFRPVKLLRFLRLKQRYRDIMNTLVDLSQRLISVGILLVIIYYFFSIIGMEFFDKAVTEGCCNNSWYGVEQYYIGPQANNSLSPTPNVYYFLNFNNILRSYVTLFILMVVNNWYIIMEGVASTSMNDWLVRIYFMAFYIITLVVLQVIISFIVEAFVFKIQAAERKRNCLKHPNRSCYCYKAQARKRMVTILLVSVDIIKLRYEIAYNDETEKVKTLNLLIRHHRRVDLNSLSPSQTLSYFGRRLRTKDDIYLLMYRSELQLWIQERDKQLEASEVVKEKIPIWKVVGARILSFIEYFIE